jgi:hypothetical protein
MRGAVILFCAAICALSSGAARADEAQVLAAESSYVRAQFAGPDRDGHGRGTREELPPVLVALLPVADENADGALDGAEYATFHRDPGGARRTPTPADVEIVEDIAYGVTDHPRQRLDCGSRSGAPATRPCRWWPTCTAAHGTWGAA